MSDLAYPVRAPVQLLSSSRWLSCRSAVFRSLTNPGRSRRGKISHASRRARRVRSSRPSLASRGHHTAMPPKRKAAQPVRRSPLPPPNTGHPCADLLATALAASNCADRPHSPAYHAFLTSPYYPSKTNASDEPPKKRARGAATAPKLPPPLDNAIEALEVQRKLLAWFDGIKEKRGMPWRKDVDPEKLSRAERNQRGYEVRRAVLPESPKGCSEYSFSAGTGLGIRDHASADNSRSRHTVLDKLDDQVPRYRIARTGGRRGSPGAVEGIGLLLTGEAIVSASLPP